MTASPTADAAAAGAVLERARQAVLLILESSPCPPTRLSVRVGEVAIEVAWAAPNVASAPAAAPPEPAAAVTPADATASHGQIVAPIVGTFYRAPEAGAKPFASEGDVVWPRQQVAIVEAMKLMVPVEADRPGRVTGILKADGEPVEYGEPLFALSPADEA
jgi:acetyl-CoA carboxylase biotin carboxyl carrier protein